MKAIVTCGPSYEPIDRVRRLSNFSTGELGVWLSEQLAGDGFEVFCFKGSGATYGNPRGPCHFESFNTNDDLLNLLAQASAAHEMAAVFHVAALCDYKIKTIEDEQGQTCNSPKITSRSGALRLRLEPATKVICQMRHLFPESIIVGWKYEVAGARQEAVTKAYRQIYENGTDASVLNGHAYGSGFMLCQPPSRHLECSDKGELIELLSAWLQETLCRQNDSPIATYTNKHEC